MAKKKKGKIAVPYIIALVVLLAIVGGSAKWIFDYLRLGENTELPELMEHHSVQAEYSDSHTVLLMLETPYKSRGATFAVMRSVPKDKKLIFAGIPANTFGKYKGEDATLSYVYTEGGMDDAADFLSNVLDISIDRYMKFDTRAFETACGIIGGVKCTPEIQIPGLGEAGKEYYMLGSHLIEYLTYPGFAEGEMHRSFITGSVLSAMMNQTDYMRISENLTVYFDTITNLTETNITALDFKNYRNAIRYMFEKGTAIGGYAYVTGKQINDSFVIDEGFCKSFKNEYFSQTDGTVKPVYQRINIIRSFPDKMKRRFGALVYEPVEKPDFITALNQLPKTLEDKVLEEALRQEEERKNGIEKPESTYIHVGIPDAFYDLFKKVKPPKSDSKPEEKTSSIEEKTSETTKAPEKTTASKETAASEKTTESVSEGSGKPFFKIPDSVEELFGSLNDSENTGDAH